MFRKILESKIILVILFIALALLWGLSFVFIKKSIAYFLKMKIWSLAELLKSSKSEKDANVRKIQ